MISVYLLGSEGIVQVAHKGQSNMPLLFTPYFGQLDQLTFFFPINAAQKNNASSDKDTSFQLRKFCSQ